MVISEENIFRDRLLMIMKDQQWSQSKLAVLLGIKPQHLNKYLLPVGVKDRRDPENLIPKLAKIGISIDWLYTGNGTMFLEDVRHKCGEEDDRYAKAGKLLYEAIATLQHPQNDDIRSTVERILQTKPRSSESGTGPELTEEEYFRLVELLRNPNKRCNFTDNDE